MDPMHVKNGVEPLAEPSEARVPANPGILQGRSDEGSTETRATFLDPLPAGNSIEAFLEIPGPAP